MDTIETEIQAKGLTAPRVTPDDIEASIASESYFTAADGVRAASQGMPGESLLPEYVTDAGSPLSLLTFCILVLRNGTKIVGINYGAIDPAQHSAKRGRAEARAHAVEQIWPLLGYALRENLHNLARGPVEVETKTYPDGVTATGRAPLPEASPAAPKIIPPTIGRRVWYWPSRNTAQMGFIYNDSAQPLDAGIAYVWSDRLVNISVADQNGVIHSRTSVKLLQEGDLIPEHGNYCQWMPYQLGQAKK